MAMEPGSDQYIKMTFEALNKASPEIYKIMSDITKLGSTINNTAKAQIDATKAARDAALAADEQAAAARRLRDAQEATTHSTSNASVRFEAMVLGHELLQGSYKRLIASSMVMAERLDLLKNVSMALVGPIIAAGLAIYAMGHHAIAVEELAQAFNHINAAMEGTGRSATLSNKQIASMVDQLRLISGISKSDAIEVLTTFAHVPELLGPQMEKLTKLVADFSAVTGKSAVESAKSLAEALVHPSEGAKALDKQLNFLSASQLESIDKFTRLGEVAKAQEIIMAALEVSIKGVHEKSLTPFQKAVEEFNITWQKLTGGMNSPESKSSWVNGGKEVEAFTEYLKVNYEWLKGNLTLTNLWNAARGKQVFVQESSPTTTTNKPVSGKIGGGPSTTDQLADEAKATKLATEAENNRIKSILESNRAYKSHAEQIEEYKQKLIGLKTVIDSPTASAADKALAQKEVAGINEAMLKNRGLLDEIVRQQERNVDAQRVIFGLEKMTASEKLLLDIQNHKYDKYPDQLKELTALAEKGIALEKEAKSQTNVRDIMKGLATLDEESIKRNDKNISQMDVINRKILEVTKNRKDSGIEEMAESTRKIMIDDQVAINRAALAKTEVELNKGVETQLKNIDQANQKYALTANQLHNLNEIETVKIAYDTKLNALSKDMIDYEEEKNKLLADQADALAKLAAKQAERTKFEGDWTNGAKKAMNEFKDAAGNTADLTYKIFQTSFSSISGVFENFMKTGKLSFASLGTSFKATIDKMVADALAAKLMNSLLGNFNGTGQIGGIVGAGADFLKGMFRADGGDVTAGQAYIVGEKRAELFVPKVNGTIVPNLNGIGSSGGPTVHVNITAMDSQDVRRALERDSRWITSMVQGTNRTYNMGGK